MTSRVEIDALMRELYTARARGDLDGVCRLFSDEAKFEIASAGNGNRLAVNSNGRDELRPLLTLLMRTFRIANQEIRSIVIDGPKAVGHWRANVYSRITGSFVPTEFIDIVQVQDCRISSYLEFFVPL